LKSEILIKLFCFFLLVTGFIWQTACVSAGNSSQSKEKLVVEKISEESAKTYFLSPSEASFEREKTEALKLVEAGVTFKNTLSAHGMPTDKGVLFGTNEFETSDGVKVIRHAQLYNSHEEVSRQFDLALTGADRIFEKGYLLNQQTERFVGATQAWSLFMQAVIIFTGFPALRLGICWLLR
jgi:hypothetical protein